MLYSLIDSFVAAGMTLRSGGPAGLGCVLNGFFAGQNFRGNHTHPECFPDLQTAALTPRQSVLNWL